MTQGARHQKYLLSQLGGQPTTIGKMSPTSSSAVLNDSFVIALNEEAAERKTVEQMKEEIMALQAENTKLRALNSLACSGTVDKELVRETSNRSFRNIPTSANRTSSRDLADILRRANSENSERSLSLTRDLSSSSIEPRRSFRNANNRPFIPLEPNSARPTRVVSESVVTGVRERPSFRSLLSFDPPTASNDSVDSRGQRLSFRSIRSAEGLASVEQNGSGQLKSASFDSKSIQDFLESARLAASLSSPLENGCHAQKYFSSFFLLSAAKKVLDENSGSYCFHQMGSRFLDPFVTESMGVMDVYPKPDSTSDESNTFNYKSLAKHCNPSGIHARLIPKVSIERARDLGWEGKKGDTAQVLVFADGADAKTFGVAIIVKEEVHLPELKEELVSLRSRRRASRTLVRFWKRNQKQALSSRSRSRGSAASENSVPQGSIRNIFSGWLQPHDSPQGRRAAIMAREQRGSFCFADNAIVRATTSQSSRNMVSVTLERFLSTSPLPKFDPDTEVGVWVSAKLKSCRRTKEKKIVLKLVPWWKCKKHTQVDIDGDIVEKVEEERLRLLDMMKDVRVTSEVTAPCQGVTKVLLQVAEDLSTFIPKKYHEEDGTSCCSTSCRRIGHAVESYRVMKEAEEVGDTCIVEKSYVMLGSRPNEQALVLRALEQIVGGERKHPNRCENGAEEHLVTYRHKALEFLSNNASPPQEEQVESNTSNNLETEMKIRKNIQLKLPSYNLSPIEIPLPLPQLSSEFGFGTLLLRMGCGSLMKLLLSLLCERQILVLGTNAGEVTCSASALMDLLKPFEWSCTFFPLLPRSHLDFVISPSPFLAGMVVESEAGCGKVQKHEVVKEAMSNGMSILNLNSGKVITSVEFDREARLLSSSPKFVEALHSLQTRFSHLAEEDDSIFVPSPRDSTGDDVTDESRLSLQTFARHGLSQRESITLGSAKQQIFNYMTSLARDLYIENTSWQRCGQCDEGDEPQYTADVFLEPMRARLGFLEEIAKTKLLGSSVAACRKEDLSRQEERELAGKIISNWYHARKEELDAKL